MKKRVKINSMRTRKIFIGINLPDQVKKRLFEKIEKWRDLPVRWSEEKNLHITVFFVGYVNDEIIADICRKVGEAVENIEAFDVILEKIVLSPDAKRPKMILAEGGSSEELKKLESKIAQKIGVFLVERKIFRPHVTLGRTRPEKWAKFSEKPMVIDEKFSASIPVESVDVFESRANKGRREYVILEKCSLK